MVRPGDYCEVRNEHSYRSQSTEIFDQDFSAINDQVQWIETLIILSQ